ncbi:MAG: tRNA (N6-threonylcarbamoyladenosine(37)-N6)-methyltransferase TrmO [Oscillospiraceae bacterium]|nr:tRNA (N6-threonylcarbamoyladenosine(37)-N6)-methyltransferase TrmO [Oscillospiraceae bacterium]MBR0208831.1 tRNA (N6-threonylcarbamoyladenosine(37)-N6)-methyltransferase TrmO [Oscillospiraceae bacterium]
MREHTIRPVAHIESDFPEKFGIPRQAGVVDALRARVVFDGEYRNDDALRGIEGFSHLWLIWHFSESERDAWSPTVRPPRLGGNTRMGVFATRSPFRPNALGLSCVRLLGLEKCEGKGTTLLVAGADLMDGTPIFDIKPYIPYADCHVGAAGGFAPDAGRTLAVVFAPEQEEKVPAEKRAALRGVLANDPRPRYQDDPERVYAMSFASMTVRFRADGEKLTVTEVIPE